MREYHGNVSIGAISSKINLEGPIVKDKLSFNVSFRRTYSDLLLKPFLWAATHLSDDFDGEKVSFGYYFYDLNAKLNWRISDKDRVYLSFYSGDDAVYMKITEFSKPAAARCMYMFLVGLLLGVMLLCYHAF